MDLSITLPMSFAQILRRHVLLGVMVLCYVVTAYWLSQFHNISVHDEKAGGLFLRFLVDVPMMIFFVLLWRLLDLTYFKRVPDRVGVLKAEVRSFLSQRDRMISGLLATLIMSLTLVAFAQLKNLIPVLNPFSWDMFFMQLDRDLHFGQHPYELAHAVFGGHYSISLFTGIYNFWLFMMYFVLLAACFMRPESHVRMQFLIAFLLTWAIGGNLIATVFSSVGPVYFANLGLGDTYTGLMDRLNSHASTGALTVIETQDLLWYMHTKPQHMLNTISAFPSMHVASSVLMAIFLRRVSRVLGLMAWVFATGIMIGSVLLAWHYAVDGYAGGLIAVAAWFVAGGILRVVHGAQPDHLVKQEA